MAGVKGRSGRAIDDSAYAARRSNTIRLAWDIYEKTLLHDGKITADMKFKAELAKALCVRDMPEIKEHSGEINTGVSEANIQDIAERVAALIEK